MNLKLFHQLWRNLVERFFAWLYLMWCGSIRFVFAPPYTEGPVVMGNWHQEVFMDVYWGKLCKKVGKKIATIVSLHRDGTYVEKACNACGVQVVRGSTDRTEGNIYRDLLTYFREDHMLVFTLDGPLGPYHTLHSGILVFARRNKVPIQLLLCYPRHAKLFHKAWDRFLLPLPFTRVDTFVSTLFYYDETGSFADNKDRLQKFLFEERIRFMKQIGKLEHLEKFIGKEEEKLFNDFKKSQQDKKKELGILDKN